MEEDNASIIAKPTKNHEPTKDRRGTNEEPTRNQMGNRWGAPGGNQKGANKGAKRRFAILGGRILGVLRWEAPDGDTSMHVGFSGT